MPNKLKISQNPDISIIGGGMVGISLALLLSSYKLGWKIQIIDSRSLLAKSNNTLDNRFDRRTTALSQSSYEIYTALGLWEKLNVNASPINEVHISDKGFFGNAKLTAQDQNLPALGYILENQTISDTLLDKAIKIDDIEIIDTAKINKIKPVSGAVELCYSKISEPDEIRNINTKLLIIADGAESDTRNFLGIESTTKDYGQVAIVSNMSLSKYHNLFTKYLEDYHQKENPKGLYEPISYILSLGGKRLRPLLTLMATEAFGKDANEALAAALSVEIFHNFTLMHDDIMDAAPLRRGKPTVHHKWNTNTGILSGDAMLIQGYQCLEIYEDPLYGKLNKQMSKTALEVCEGQQYDVDFETENDVSIVAYLEMIKLKTAVLVGHALKVGAWIGNASDEEAQKIYDFGVLLGLAFQIQDDYLDAFGDPEDFGKQVGGDIIENKKTILYHKVMELGSANEKESLLKWFDFKGDNTKKVSAVKIIFDTSGATKASKKLVSEYTQLAFEKLEEIKISDEGRESLKAFGKNLMERKF